MSPSLRQAAAGGLRWTASATLFITFAYVVQMAALARILEPEEFGLVALSIVVVSFGVAFSDLGLSNVIIARNVRSPNVLSSLYWANVAGGVAVGGCVALAAPAVAGFFNSPELAPVLRLCSLIFVAASLGLQFQTLLQRDLRFGTLAKIDGAAAVIGAAVAIALAVAGTGAAAFVLGALATTLVRAGLMFRAARGEWRPRLHVRVAEIRKHMGFGFYQLGERMINPIAANLDYIGIGRILGAAALAPYVLAYQITIVPSRLLGPSLTRVGLPLFALPESDDPRIGKGYAELLRLLALTAIPALAIVAGLAPILIPTLFGPGWEVAVGLLPILAILGALQTFGSPAGTVLVARNRPDLGFAVHLGFLVVFAVAVVGVTQFGLEAIAWAYVCVEAVFLAIFTLLIRRLALLSIRRQAGAISRGLGVAAIGFVTTHLMVLAVPAGWTDPAALLAVLPLSIAITMLSAIALDGRYVREQIRVFLAPFRGGESATRRG